MADGFDPILNNKPSEKSTLAAAAHRFLSNGAVEHESMLPAVVVSYDRTNNIATVKPLIKYVMIDGTTQSRVPMVNIPVLALGGGGFFINFPIAVGDLGWILATDRSIALFQQTLSEQPPPDGGPFHKFESGLFIPDVFRKYTIAGADSAAMVISTTDSNTRISIKPGEIDIIAPTTVKITTPLAVFSKDVQIAGNLSVTGNATITGATTVNGGFSAGGSSGTYVTLPANTTINGIVVATHGHTQNGTSGRTSGGMLS